MTRFVLALDQGTTSSRSILFDHDGGRAIAQREFTQHFPRSGWVEHDAEEIWATQAATIAEVLARARATPDDVAAIGITNQRETTVLWDRATGRPVAPAIVWQDRRTADAMRAGCKADGHEPRLHATHRACCSIPISRAPSSRGCSTTCRARARAERGELAFGTIDSWLAWKLTGGEPAHHRRDQREPHAAARHRHGRLGRRHARTAAHPARRAAARRASSLAHGEAHAVLGGREVIADRRHRRGPAGGTVRPGLLRARHGQEHLRHRLLPADEHGREPLARPTACSPRSRGTSTGVRYALEGSVFVGGAVVQWLRDGLGFIEKLGRVEALAASVPDAGGVYLVPAFTGARQPALGRLRARHDGRPVARHHRRTSHARRSRRSPSRARRCCSPCSATRASRWSSCAWTAARPATTC
jgi:glycerol kinase